MGKIQQQEKVSVINNFTLQADKQFVANTTVRVNGRQEVTVVRKAKSLEEAEELVLARAEQILFGEQFASLQQNDNFSLSTKYASVILEEGKMDAVSGVKTAAKTAEQVTVDLITRDAEGNVLKQAVVTRLGDSLVDVESEAISKALRVIGIGE